MPYYKYTPKNDAVGQLLGNILAAGVTIVLKTGQGSRFPTGAECPFKATLRKYAVDGSVTKREIVKVTNRVGDTLTVVRGAEATRISDTTDVLSTTSSTFDTDDYISMDITADFVDDIQDEVTRLETDKLAKSGGTMTGPLLQAQSTNLASATTTDLSTMTGDSGIITGTTTITSFGTMPAGAIKYLTFSGILTLTHNATSMILPNAGSNITTAAGDTATMISLGGGNWKCDKYTRANGTALVSAPAPSASTTVEGIVELATDAEALAGTDQTRYINSKQAKNNYLMVTDAITISRNNSTASGAVVYNHSLGKVPKLIRFSCIEATNQWCDGNYDGGANNCIYPTGTPGVTADNTNCIVTQNGAGSRTTGIVTAVTTTTFTITWTRVSAPTGTAQILVDLFA